MRPVSIEDTPLIDALSRVIGRHGFEGASLQLLSDAAGLKRASLYHRFPGGKDEILAAALDRAAERFAVMLAPAFDEGNPGDRAALVAERIDEYYDGGQESCLIVALTLADDERRSMAAPCLSAWADAFAAIAVDAGVAEAEAIERGQDLVAQLEGALVIASSTGDRAPFRRAIARLARALTSPSVL